MPIYDKMEGAGYVVRGPCTRTDKEGVLEEIGDRDFYKKTTR